MELRSPAAAAGVALSSIPIPPIDKSQFEDARVAPYEGFFLV
jgi:hypothetical protein